MEIRRFQPGDETEISVLIRRTLLEINSVDCPQEEIDFLYRKYSPETIASLAAAGHTYVLYGDGVILGTGTLLPTGTAEVEIVAAFLLPEAIGRGLGRKLFASLESDPLAMLSRRIWLTSSVTALDFYEKIGYTYLCGYRRRNKEGLLVLEKLQS